MTASLVNSTRREMFRLRTTASRIKDAWIIAVPERFMRQAILSVVAERGYQLGKWGAQHHQPAVWLAILTEEVGEVAKEIADATAGGIKFNHEHYRNELVQVAAVAVAAIESLDVERSSGND